jgi:hypothetical protein
MFILGHLSFPSIIFIAVAEIFGIEYTYLHIILLMLFSVLPDIDIVYAVIKSRTIHNKYSHHEFFTHWPVTYSPLIMLMLLHPNIYTAVMVLGVYSHMIMDTFISGKGIMWSQPLSRKYYNFFAGRTTGKENTDWLRAYVKTASFKTEIVGFLLLMYFLMTLNI